MNGVFQRGDVFIYFRNFPSRDLRWNPRILTSQYQYKIRKTSDENQEKYQLGDY